MSWLLLLKWYWCGTLAPGFTADDSIPGSHSAADVFREDDAVLAAATSVLLLGLALLHCLDEIMFSLVLCLGFFSFYLVVCRKCDSVNACQCCLLCLLPCLEDL
jgi:hypothetical protein